VEARNLIDRSSGGHFAVSRVAGQSPYAESLDDGSDGTEDATVLAWITGPRKSPGLEAGAGLDQH